MHERQKIAHADRLDLLKLRQDLAEVGLFEHSREGHDGLDELQRFLVFGVVFQGGAGEFHLEPGNQVAKLAQLGW